MFFLRRSSLAASHEAVSKSFLHLHFQIAIAINYYPISMSTAACLQQRDRQTSLNHAPQFDHDTRNSTLNLQRKKKWPDFFFFGVFVSPLHIRRNACAQTPRRTKGKKGIPSSPLLFLCREYRLFVYLQWLHNNHSIFFVSMHSITVYAVLRRWAVLFPMLWNGR